MTMADLTERLMAEFEHRHSLTRIVSVVADCRREAEGRPLSTQLGLVEDLARRRLLEGLDPPAVPAPRRPGLYLT
jgi:hypothetical protein